MIPKKTYATALAILSIIPCVAAESAPVSGVNVGVMLLVPAGPTMELFSVNQNTKKVQGPILVGARGISDMFAISSRQFSFAVKDKSAESGYRAVANVIVPDSGGDFIVLLEPKGNQFRTHIINGDSLGFGNNSTLFFNATDVPLGIVLGDYKKVLPPRQPTIMDAPEKGERPWFQVTFYESVDGQSRMFNNTRWPHRNASRSYLFFYRSEKSGRISFQAVDEALVPEDN